jgi:hypothetical protein
MRGLKKDQIEGALAGVTLATGRLSLLKLSLRAGWLSRFHYFMEPETEEIVDVGGDDLDGPNLTRKKKCCLPVELCFGIFGGGGRCPSKKWVFLRDTSLFRNPGIVREEYRKLCRNRK